MTPVPHLPFEAELITRYIKGDQRAFTTLYEWYAPRLKSFVLRIVKNEEDAEEIVQDTFARVARHASNFDQVKKFSTWVYTIAANLCKNLLRNTGRRPTTSIDHMQEDCEEARGIQLTSPGLDPHELCCLYDVMELVNKAVGELPVEQQEILLNRDVDGFTYNQLAFVAEINLGTVKSRLNRGRSGVRRKLKEKGIHGAH